MVRRVTPGPPSPGWGVLEAAAPVLAKRLDLWEWGLPVEGHALAQALASGHLTGLEAVRVSSHLEIGGVRPWRHPHGVTGPSPPAMPPNHPQDKRRRAGRPGSGPDHIDRRLASAEGAPDVQEPARPCSVPCSVRTQAVGVDFASLL